ncbi:MAG: Ppx/GppA phosphatase family protein [Acidobacteriia bacterium]|nr:Ppx/GppA phosphatase family protein [Terriglobia bacterium]
MKIAAIDVGSNSIHMIVVQSHGGTDFEIIDREKEMVRLGSGSFESRELSEPAMARAEACLRQYQHLAERLGVDHLIAMATSAVREARNGGDFIHRIHERVGVHIEVITSQEEARLIALAVQHSVDFRGRRAVLIDLGGGSIELSVADAEKIHRSESRKLGVIRMTDRFVKRDPIGKKARRNIARHVEKRTSGIVRAAKKLGFRFGVGTSGTVLTLADVACQVKYGESLDHFHQEKFKRAELQVANDWLQSRTLKERTRLKGVNEARAQSIVAGGIALETLMKQLGLKEITLSTRALREGMIIDFLQRQRERGKTLAAAPDIRRESVMELARRSNFDRQHAGWIVPTVLEIFDATRRFHRLGPAERGLLEYAAILHDIGILISYTRHHRHSEYIIRNADLRGFTPGEIELLALLARFHRKAEPSRQDLDCALMPKKEFETLRTLSAIVRVADGMDRSHHQILKLRALHHVGKKWRFDVEACDDAELEFWGARRKASLFEKVFQGKLEFRVIKQSKRRRK